MLAQGVSQFAEKPEKEKKKKKKNKKKERREKKEKRIWERPSGNERPEGKLK